MHVGNSLESGSTPAASLVSAPSRLHCDSFLPFLFYSPFLLICLFSWKIHLVSLFDCVPFTAYTAPPPRPRRVRELEEECVRLQRLLDEVTQHRDMLEQELRTVATDSEAAHRQFLVADADRRDLRERIDSLQASLHEKTACLTATRADRDKLQGEHTACCAELDRERLAHRETAHELERARLAHEAALNECTLARAAIDEGTARHSTLAREMESVTIELNRSENRRDELEVDSETLRRDNEALAARLDAASRERAMMADRLNARGPGMTLAELTAENATLKEGLVETERLAEQLREQLMRKQSELDATNRELQETIDLLRRTKALIQEEERQMRRYGYSRR